MKIRIRQFKFLFLKLIERKIFYIYEIITLSILLIIPYKFISENLYLNEWCGKFS